jgi:prephenate dehydrogenase
MTIITIIGAAGKMGKWFFQYFNNLKNNPFQPENVSSLSIDKILLYDIKQINYIHPFDNNEQVVITNSVSESVKISDIILFCIPVNEIIKIINHNIAKFKPGSLIIEISSVKSTIHKTLSAISLSLNIVTLCIHPMFGPGASIFSKNKAIYIPVNNNCRKTEEDLLNKIFPSFDKIIIENPNKHDLAISVIISLIYFINLVFSKFLVEVSNTKEFQFEDDLLQFFKKISGSTFKIQSLLSESILTDDVSLFLTLFFDNDKSAITINKYRQLFDDLLDKIEKKDQNSVKKYISTTKNSIKKDVDINKSYKILYKFLNSQ